MSTVPAKVPFMVCIPSIPTGFFATLGTNATHLMLFTTVTTPGADEELFAIISLAGYFVKTTVNDLAAFSTTVSQFDGLFFSLA